MTKVPQTPMRPEELHPSLTSLTDEAQRFAAAASTRFAEGDGHLFQANFDDGLVIVAAAGAAAEMLRPFLDTIPAVEAHE